MKPNDSERGRTRATITRSAETDVQDQIDGAITFAHLRRNAGGLCFKASTFPTTQIL
ncbi:MAG: hypothetical protein MI923_14075 [Phycisphaerales bacterium]|nr:hypothetical protein [Phycisphaerales bacterium]